MNTTKIRYAIDIGLLVSFFSVFVTGTIKHPITSSGIWARLGIYPTYGISQIHDTSGLVMGILVLLHLVLNWKWIVATTKMIISGK